MTNELYQLLLSLKIGDGCYVNQRKKSKPTYYLTTRSINSDYIDYKQHLLNKYNIFTRKFTGVSGFNSLKIQSCFRTRVEPEITLVGRMSVDEILDCLDIYGLCLYYLDDGSLHKHKHFMNLNCNSFTYKETEHLIDVIYKIFPIQRCSHRIDKKKSGKQYNYVYVPPKVAREFSKYVHKFLIDNNIQSLLYKTIPPSQTIESIK